MRHAHWQQVTTNIHLQILTGHTCALHELRCTATICDAHLFLEPGVVVFCRKDIHIHTIIRRHASCCRDSEQLPYLSRAWRFRSIRHITAAPAALHDRSRARSRSQGFRYSEIPGLPNPTTPQPCSISCRNGACMTTSWGAALPGDRYMPVVGGQQQLGRHPSNHKTRTFHSGHSMA